VRNVYIKICGITNVEDALVAAHAGATAIGLIFAPISKRLVDQSTASAVVAALPDSARAVGVFLGQDATEIYETAQAVGLEAVQVHGTNSVDEIQWLAQRIPVVVRAFSVHDVIAGLADGTGASQLFVDSSQPGSGETFDWDLLNGATWEKDYILAGGLDPDNVAEAISTLRPWGVDVASGVELTPGKKDHDKVRAFVARAVEAYQTR